MKTPKRTKTKQDKKEKKLKITGSFEDVLKVAVSGNPKPKEKKK
jgi:hypothetical protein